MESSAVNVDVITSISISILMHIAVNLVRLCRHFSQFSSPRQNLPDGCLCVRNQLFVYHPLVGCSRKSREFTVSLSTPQLYIKLLWITPRGSVKTNCRLKPPSGPSISVPTATVTFRYSCALPFAGTYGGSHPVPVVKPPKPEILPRTGQTKVTTLIFNRVEPMQA